MDGPVPELADRAVACAERLLAADRVLLASHIDADGLTSAAIASRALERAGIPHEVVFEKQLDEAAIGAIAETGYDTVLFTDFGSGQLDVIADHEAAGAFTPVIADHHQPADADTEFHLNPLLVGIDGASELSGAGASYVLARALETTGNPREGDSAGNAQAEGSAETGPEADSAETGRGVGPAEIGPEASATDGSGGRVDNRDLAALAVVGAVGDMQASGGELHGANAAVVEEGVEAGVVETVTDLALYGKQTRPLPKLFEYATDVHVPGISNDQAGALAFLDGLDVELERDGEWRTWADLTAEEKRTVASALVRRAVEAGVPASKIEQLVGTAYVLSEEPVGTELRDASEFSTLLNATARYERADVGLAVCLGDRDGALDRARTLLRDHRRNLSAGIELVTEEGVSREENLQWFHAGDRIRETIVGIVAGMALGNDGISRELPILAFAEADDGELKVSARGTHALVRRGLDLSTVVGEAARAVGGDGGGHDVAAGATVPEGRETEFLARADAIVGDQLA